MYWFYFYHTDQWYSCIFTHRTMLGDWKHVWNLEHLCCKHHFSALLHKRWWNFLCKHVLWPARQRREGILVLEAPEDGCYPVVWLLWAETYIHLQSKSFILWRSTAGLGSNSAQPWGCAESEELSKDQKKLDMSPWKKWKGITRLGILPSSQRQYPFN